jgi:23S rRNA G2445 N2-methylase RlmL
LAEADAVPDIASDPARFRLRLRRLLSLDRTLGITAKAIDVALEHEHTYCQARVLTDIRPIFTRDLSEQPAGAVIVHSLRLRHHVADSVREFFIAMTQTELDELRNVLYRASDKAATLRELLSAAGIPELTREGDETDGAGN